MLDIPPPTTDQASLTMLDTVPVAAGLAAVRAGELGTVFAVHLELAVDLPLPTVCRLAADTVLRLIVRPLHDVHVARSGSGTTVSSSWSLQQASATVTVTSADWAAGSPVVRLRVRGTRASLTADLARYEDLVTRSDLPLHPDAGRVADLLIGKGRDNDLRSSDHTAGDLATAPDPKER